MRTTVDLPEDLHRIVASVARDRGESFSTTVAHLLREVVAPAAGHTTMTRSPVTGLPTVRLGHVTTQDDIRSLEDDE